MINIINKTNFQSRFCNKYSYHTPKARLYREFEFMPELQKQNNSKKILKKIVKAYNHICEFIKIKYC